MTITITLKETENVVAVEVQTHGIPAATHKERLFSVGIIESVKVSIPLLCKMLGGEQITCIEREAPTTTTE